MSDNRTTKVPFKQFCKGYATGCKTNLSPEETLDLIEKISGIRMNLSSMVQRASGIRRKYAESGIKFPSLAGTTMSQEEKEKKNVDFLTDLIGGLDEDSDDSSEETETETV